MKLYEVEITMSIVVAAESDVHAWHEASDAWHEVRREQEPEFNVLNEITEEKQLPDLWSIDCLPYGGDDEKEIGEYLDEVTYPDIKTIDMFTESGK